MNEKDYLKDISEIKTLMNKSSRFISLSGLSGIMAGVYALTGAAHTYWLVNNKSDGYLVLGSNTFNLVLVDLFLIAFLGIVTGIILTTRKAKKEGLSIWDATTKRLVFNFLLPLIAGGIYIIIIVNQQKYGQTGALMLLFYGLALVNASKYTFGDIKYLGYLEITLGLICALFPSFGFWFWVIGFGVLHILYGTLMHFKYDKK